MNELKKVPPPGKYRAWQKLPSVPGMRVLVRRNPDLTQGDIADLYGCSRSAVCMRLKEAGVQAKPGRVGQDRILPEDEVLIELYGSASLRALADRYGVSRVAVHNHFKRLRAEGRIPN